MVGGRQEVKISVNITKFRIKLQIPEVSFLKITADLFKNRLMSGISAISRFHYPLHHFCNVPGPAGSWPQTNFFSSPSNREALPVVKWMQK